MIERVIYTAEADDDLAESCEWYESIRQDGKCPPSTLFYS